MTREYLPFADWMKFLGIVLIVHGHVSNSPWLATAPIYEKQLGVAFFVFVTGFLLARDTRPSWRVIYNRLFELYLYGVALALLISVMAYVDNGHLRTSNYAPFALGMNVFINFFPANPTTWFLGMYLHLLLVWAWVLRSVRIRPWMLAVSLVAEVAIRAAVMARGTEMVAYMILPNWSTCLLLGLYEGQGSAAVERRRFALPGLGLAAMAGLWPMVTRLFAVANGFPFRHMGTPVPSFDLLVTSAMISTLYASYAWLLFGVARHLPSLGPVRFVARNTPIIFLAHMPLYYAMLGPLEGLRPYYGWLVAVLMTACVAGLALVSEGIGRLVRPRELRDRLMNAITARWPRALPALSGSMGAREQLLEE